MFKTNSELARTISPETEDQPSEGKHIHAAPEQDVLPTGDKERINPGLIDWVKKTMAKSKDTTLREVLEEFIEGAEHGLSSLTGHERALIANILKLRDLNVMDVMIPRVDIVAIDASISQKELLSLLAEKQFSRLPVYRDSLDDVLGTIHIKDILAALARGEQLHVPDLVRDVPIIAPSMPVLDLLLMMKQKRRHMALVVDEYGGIDGLATVGDVIEAIVGEVEDEYDQDDQQTLRRVGDGSILADGRVDLDTFENEFGHILTDEERDDVDTLGGLVFSLAGRIPARGEILTHSSGMVFEVLDADMRRVKQLLIKNIPAE